MSTKIIQPDIISLIKALRKYKKEIRISNIEKWRIKIYVGRGVFLRDFDPPKEGERMICFSKDEENFVDPLLYGYVVRLAEEGFNILAYPCCSIKAQETHREISLFFAEKVYFF